VCVCVCVRERERERAYVNLHKELYDAEHTKMLYESVANII